MTTLSSDRRPAGWDASAEAYERVVAPTTARYATDALRLAEVRAGERVLDVAAGTGALALQAAKMGARVLATDFAPEMVRRLRARIDRERASVDTAVMDGQALDLPDASFDVAASVFGLIFFPDRAAGLREMHRVLRPGGRAALATWSAPSRVRLVTVVSDAVRAALPELPAPAAPPAIFSMADPKQIEAETRDAGFRETRVHTLSHTWVFPTPEAVWTDLVRASPVFTTLLEGLAPAQRERVHTAVLDQARRDVRDGQVELPSEAHIVIARKSP